MVVTDCVVLGGRFNISKKKRAKNRIKSELISVGREVSYKKIDFLKYFFLTFFL